MTQTEKYIWLIDKIYKAKKISLADISLRWRDDMGLVVEDYMASLPLHDRQWLIEDPGEYSDFELTVAPTYDLVMKLLLFGAMVEVIEPISLRNTMRGCVSELHEMYNK